ncbi:hypothetical protein [Streptomyces sp. NPDC059631]|uniref:hypothetical protein n=1 Tax=unclassified Streptomyces TaxID=2593676 RepID=UPI0036ADF856
MAVITAPVEGFTGPGVGGLVFQDGRAETDHPAVISYARRHGYGVEDDEPPHAPPSGTNGPDAVERPARNASKAEWVAYADRQNPGDHEAMTKDELIQTYGG